MDKEKNGGKKNKGKKEKKKPRRELRRRFKTYKLIYIKREEAWACTLREKKRGRNPSWSFFCAN